MPAGAPGETAGRMLAVLFAQHPREVTQAGALACRKIFEQPLPRLQPRNLPFELHELLAGDGPPTLARSYGWRKAANHGLDLANTKACLQRQAYKEQVIKHAGVVNAPAFRAGLGRRPSLS